MRKLKSFLLIGFVFAFALPISLMLVGCGNNNEIKPYPRSTVVVLQIMGNPSEDEIDAKIFRLQNLLWDAGLSSNVVRIAQDKLWTSFWGEVDVDDILDVINTPVQLDFRSGDYDDDILFVANYPGHVLSVSVVMLGYNYAVQIQFTESGGQLLRDAVDYIGAGNRIQIHASYRMITNPVIYNENLGHNNTMVISFDGMNLAFAQQIRTGILSGIVDFGLELYETYIVMSN